MVGTPGSELSGLCLHEDLTNIPSCVKFDFDLMPSLLARGKKFQKFCQRVGLSSLKSNQSIPSTQWFTIEACFEVKRLVRSVRKSSKFLAELVSQAKDKFTAS